MIINRYLNKEILQNLGAVTLVLLLVFLCQQTVRYLGYAVSGKIASNILLPLLGLEIPYLLVILLPLGLYLGMFLVYTRLFAESEMLVLNISGYSFKKIVSITVPLTVLIGLTVLILSLWVNPWLAAQKNHLIMQGMTEENILKTLIPGRFQVSSEGKRVIYVEHVSKRSKKVENLFIAEEKKASGDEAAWPWVVVSAEQGAPLYDKKTQEHYVVANNGYRYEGIPGHQDYKIIQFKRYAVHLPEANLQNNRELQEGIPTPKLWQQYFKPVYAAELQWRISLALSPLLLALLALPLSHVKPRQGRYLMAVPAILIYTVYINLLFVVRRGVETGAIPIFIGMWWVHLVLLLFIIIFTHFQGLGFLSKKNIAT